MAWSASLFNTNALYQGVDLIAHGFSVGQILGYNGSAWFLAKSDNAADAQVIGMVSNVPDANSFYISQIGYIANLTTTPVNPPAGNYTAGSLYYLDATTAGALTLNPPIAVGSVVLPCFIAFTTTSGFFFESTGQIVRSGPLFTWSTVTVSTSMASNQGYFVNSVAPVNMLLPSVASVGDVVEVYSICNQQVTITQGAGQQVIYLNAFTTIGAGGSVQMLLTDGAYAGSIRLICYAANEWAVVYGSGNWDYI